MKNNNTFSIATVLKGACMGVAEVIPGVSGGTIAFITGIYERLLNCFKSFDLDALRFLKKFDFKAFFKHIDGFFLITLGAGMFIGIGIGVFGVGYLLDHFPAPLWSFFFGLITSSAFYIGKQVGKWDIISFVALIIGAAIALGVTYISPAEGTNNLIWVFICGVIAISALILPGVSGSFILLLMGMYNVVRGAAESLMVNRDMASLSTIVAFCLGCVVGLLTFARVMSYAFKNFKNTTLALLTGFMVGSLRKIWPWRNIETYMDKSTGQLIPALEYSEDSYPHVQVLKEINVLPETFSGNPQLILVIISAIIGFVLIFVFSSFEKKK